MIGKIEKNANSLLIGKIEKNAHSLLIGKIEKNAHSLLIGKILDVDRIIQKKSLFYGGNVSVEVETGGSAV